ncbi:MAG TPA: MBL fold metallo-hydrolase [Candidatus Paceibacterota bacterium]|nr:MBL fold metallo-hydrolase [Candidatus Paceibacterota bacterium]
MIITSMGGECIKMSAGETTLVFGPISKQSKNLKASSFGADIAFISLNHPDMNGIAEAGRGERQPFAATGPGEYEVATMTANGFPTATHYDGRTMNTCYLVIFDGMTVLYLGALSDGALPPSALEDVESIDILFVPIGGDGVLSASDAYKLAVKLEAKCIIPIHWDGLGEKAALPQFLKEAGAEGLKPVEKLTVKAKDVAPMNGEVVVLSS